jgi:AAA domain, putative AbiEii toxin, Type IV TA system
MLISYGAKNFFCFKEWVEISLALGPKVPVEVSSKLEASLSLCLKGGNASGKTNALKILSFLSYFCKDSFNLKPDDKIAFDSFFNNEEPSEFFVEFEKNGIKYTYELVLNRNIVLSEKIYKKEARKTLIFNRTKNIIKKNSLTKQKSNLILRSNASIISTFNQIEIKEIQSIYEFFSNITSNVNYYGLGGNNHGENEAVSKFYNDNKDYLKFTVDMLKVFDTGISGIYIDSYLDEGSKKHYFPIFKHALPDSSPELPFRVQSSGTKSLYNIMSIYLRSLKNGGILILDEFDITLHPDILPYLVDMFEDTEFNNLNAQLLFSTHNTDIMDKMGKYKTYLFNKENGESYCYRLDEMGGNVIRNDRPIVPLYKSGKIGGVPRI